LGAGVLGSRVAQAAPPSEDPWTERPRFERVTRLNRGPIGLSLGAKYEARAVAVRAIDLAEEHLVFAEHRLRLRGELDRSETLRLVLESDVVDALLGWTGDETPLYGGATSSAPVRRLDVAWLGRGSPSDPNAHGFVSERADAFVPVQLYVEAATRFGVLRVGRMARQPVGTLLASNGVAENRFGRSGNVDTADRFELRSRPFAEREAATQADPRGFHVLIHYDRVGASHGLGSRGGASELEHRVGTALDYLEVEAEGAESARAHLEASLGWGPSSNVGVLGASAVATLAGFALGAEGFFVSGRRDTARSLAALTGESATPQRLEQWGSRLVTRYDARQWGVWLGLSYASGDASPSAGSTDSRLDFARDARVGLILFEHALGYASARSASAAREALAAEYSEKDPVGIATRGAFTSAVALNPQAELRLTKRVLVRTGALLAWAPEGLADPLRSARDTENSALAAQALGFRGGAIRGWIGSELDARIAWQALDGVYLDCEGALAWPGRVLEDARGSATPSQLVEVRSTFVF
jgi:hypothetical protein